MTELVKQGKQRTINISVGVLIVSLLSIVMHHMSTEDVGLVKMISEGIRFALTAALLKEAFRGKRWARVILMIVCLIATVSSIGTFFSSEADFINKLPFLIMAIVYAVAFYHFGFSKPFKAFYEHQNRYDIADEEVY